MKTIYKNLSLWAPSLFSQTGGIQTFSFFLAKALSELSDPGSLKLFSKNDTPPSILPLRKKFGVLSTSGQYPSLIRTSAFASKILFSEFLQPSGLIVSTHLHFSPLADMLHSRRKTPYWIVAHGTEAWSIKNRKTLEALSKADRILTVSHYTKKQLASIPSINPQILTYFPNTFDEIQFVPNSKPRHLMEKYHLTPSQPILLSVARLDSNQRNKGIESVFQSMPALLQQHPDLKYFVIGDGNDQDRLRQEAEKLNLTNHVIFTGAVENLCDYYNLADVFILLSKQEGFGIVFLEALACGKPVVAANYGGSADPLQNGELGVLIDPQNFDELPQLLHSLLTKNYNHPLIFSPRQLRQKTIEAFGYNSFKQRLKTILSNSFATL